MGLMLILSSYLLLARQRSWFVSMKAHSGVPIIDALNVVYEEKEKRGSIPSGRRAVVYEEKEKRGSIPSGRRA
jgi:hypothetical protein